MTANPPTIPQWNCRSFSTANTIIAAKVKYIKPLALLLQETLTTPQLPEYNVFINPSIPRNSQVPGHAAILLDSSVPATQLPLPLSSSPLYEVVAIIAYPARAKKLILVSAYYRPRYQTCSDAFSWVQHIRNEYPSTPILIGGDFNAPHTTWGYPTNSKIGRNTSSTLPKWPTFILSMIPPILLGSPSIPIIRTPPLT